MIQFLKLVCPLTALMAIAACNDQYPYGATDWVVDQARNPGFSSVGEMRDMHREGGYTKARYETIRVASKELSTESQPVVPVASGTQAVRQAPNSVSATPPQTAAGRQAGGARKAQILNFTENEAFCLGAISSAARINNNDISIFGSNAKNVMLKYQGYLRSIKEGEEISGVYARSIEPCIKSATGASAAEQNQKFEHCIVGHGINASEKEFLRPFHRGFARMLVKKQIDQSTVREIEVICANTQKPGDPNPPQKPAQTKTDKKYFQYFSCTAEDTSLPVAETLSDVLLRYIIGNNSQAYAQLIANSGSHFSGSSPGQCVDQGVTVKNPPQGQRIKYGENEKGYFFLVKTRSVAGSGFVGVLEYK